MPVLAILTHAVHGVQTTVEPVMETVNVVMLAMYQVGAVRMLAAPKVSFYVLHLQFII